MTAGSASRGPLPGPPRETIISFTDDPGVIHRGEILPFHTKKKNEKNKMNLSLALDEMLGGDSLSSKRRSTDRNSWNI